MFHVVVMPVRSYSAVKVHTVMFVPVGLFPMRKRTSISQHQDNSG